MFLELFKENFNTYIGFFNQSKGTKINHAYIPENNQIIIIKQTDKGYEIEDEFALTEDLAKEYVMYYKKYCNKHISVPNFVISGINSMYDDFKKAKEVQANRLSYTCVTPMRLIKTISKLYTINDIIHLDFYTLLGDELIANYTFMKYILRNEKFRIESDGKIYFFNGKAKYVYKEKSGSEKFYADFIQICTNYLTYNELPLDSTIVFDELQEFVQIYPY